MELKKYSKQIISVLIIVGALGCLNIYISIYDDEVKVLLFIGVIFIIISIYFLIMYMYGINEKPRKKTTVFEKL